MANHQNEREQLGQLEWLFQQKKFAEGRDRVELALGEFPASFHLKLLKFRFLRELKQDDEALQLLLQLHAQSGDNIMVLKELADLFFQKKQYGESLQYYKKLLFLDSFNSLAHERVKLLQKLLEAGVAERLADTQVEPPSAARRHAPPAPQVISLDVSDFAEAAAAPAAAASEPPAAGPSRDEVFTTESAAELYAKQGLFREALAIYRELFAQSRRPDLQLKIQAIELLQRSDRGQRTIERLQGFLNQIQERGRQLV